MAVKLTKRKAFSFLRSYFDVINELDNDTDKFNFIMAILNKQFLDENPKNLNFISNLCYESQRHAIEKSVKGWKTATNTDLLGNPLAPLRVPKEAPLQLPKQQEQEQVEEQVKEKEKIITINNKVFLENCKKSIQWLETTAMQKQVKLETINLYLDKFDYHLIEHQEQKETLKDYKSHFVYWLNKQNLSNYRKKVIGNTNQV